jgi:DNA-binding response OmpR family regulator
VIGRQDCAGSVSVKSRGSSFYRRGRRILIVEDELFIALLIEETVRLMGCRISAIADTLSKANLELNKRNYDAVLLDLNIGGKYSTELADRIIKAKRPLAFITGYDYLVEPRHAHIPVLQKPFRPAQLNALLRQLLAPSLGSPPPDQLHTGTDPN